jgi:hypothetical protein
MSTEAATTVVTEQTPVPSLSLADLMKPKPVEEVKPTNLADAIIEKATAPVVPAAPAVPPVAAPAATLTAEEQLAADAELKKIAEEDGAKPKEGEPGYVAPEPEEGTENLTAEQFYSTLDALYGEDINSAVDYGDKDPMSPEGVFVREQHIRERSMVEFAENLKERDPRGYSYFLHRSSGGSDEEFFKHKSFVLPDLQEIRDDVDLQRDLYEQVLLNRGNTPKQVSAMIKMAIADGELLAEAEGAYTAIQANETLMAKQAEDANKLAVARTNADIKQIGDVINENINTNNALRFIIPNNEKEQFSEEFRKNVHYENGSFFLVKPINQENLSQLMEAELFSYLKGDVSKLVAKQATKVAAVRTLQRLTAKPVAASTDTPTSGKALKDILPSK